MLGTAPPPNPTPDYRVIFDQVHAPENEELRRTSERIQKQAEAIAAVAKLVERTLSVRTLRFPAAGLDEAG